MYSRFSATTETVLSSLVEHLNYSDFGKGYLSKESDRIVLKCLSSRLGFENSI
jgi:hypothetical protein